MRNRPRPPRGIRNNNPMNLRAGCETWLGQTGADEDGYCQFDTPENGIRAGARVICTYQRRYGLNTVAGIIGRYAPASENDTESYIRHVADLLELGPDEPVDMTEAARLRMLCRAIIWHENGVCPYTSDQIADGVARAIAP